MGLPLISTIIPVYNCEKYLGEAIESALNQDYPNQEIWIINDGSTDQSASIAQSFGSKIQYVEQLNQGPAVARNQGIQLAKGEFLTFLDSDDLWPKEKLSRQMAVLQANPDLDMVSGKLKQFYSPEVPEEQKQKWAYILDNVNCTLIGAILFRASCFQKVGLLRPEFKMGEFIDWYIRSQEAELKIDYLPDIVLYRRIHGKNKVIEERADYGSYVQIIKSRLDRMRQAAHNTGQGSSSSNKEPGNKI